VRHAHECARAFRQEQFNFQDVGSFTWGTSWPDKYWPNAHLPHDGTTGTQPGDRALSMWLVLNHSAVAYVQYGPRTVGTRDAQFGGGDPEERQMSQQLSPRPKSPRRQKLKKRANSLPSCRQLADRFVELQRLRQEVRAAESGQRAVRRVTPASEELA
jgi:hypothetical protein